MLIQILTALPHTHITLREQIVPPKQIEIRGYERVQNAYGTLNPLSQSHR